MRSYRLWKFLDDRYQVDCTVLSLRGNLDAGIGCDLFPGVNAGASYELGIAELGTYVYTPTWCWSGHAAVILIRQWGRGSALLTRDYVRCFTSVSTRYGH